MINRLFGIKRDLDSFEKFQLVTGSIMVTLLSSAWLIVILTSFSAR